MSFTNTGRAELKRLQDQAREGLTASYHREGGSQGAASETVVEGVGKVRETFLQKANSLSDIEKNIVS
jgi:hypothetical protein